MARRKSEYTEILFTRVTPLAKQFAERQITDKNGHQSLSEYVNYLICRDRQLVIHSKKVLKTETKC